MDKILMSFWLISFGTEKYWEKLSQIENKTVELRIKAKIFYYKDFPGQVLYKPFFILDQLRALNEPVMWIDADSKLLKTPKTGEFDFDLGTVLPPGGSKKPFADSCHFWTPSRGAIKTLKEYCRLASSGKGRCHSKLIAAVEAKNPLRKDVSNWVRGVYIRNFGGRKEIHY